jgi:hypothetical protein
LRDPAWISVCCGTVVDRLKHPITYCLANSGKGDALKLVACVLLLSGFFIVLAALVLLTSLQQRSGFVAAGFCVEVIGLGLLTQSYKSMTEEQR